MKELVRQVALNPGDLADLEWRDLERVLREALEGLGFETRLTRSGKDGGFDLEVLHAADEAEHRYLVEVKHWQAKRVGQVPYTAFLDVVIRQEATSGLLLSTSGFTKPLMQERLAFGRQVVQLGGANKVIEFCQHYTRKQFGLWGPQVVLPDLLFGDTF